MTDKPIWTEGVCGDGAAILRDGVMVRIEDVLARLNEGEIEDEQVESECRSQANLLNRAADEITSLRRQLSAAQDSHVGQQRNTIAFARENEALTERIATLNTHVAALRSVLEGTR